VSFQAAPLKADYTVARSNSVLGAQVGLEVFKELDPLMSLGMPWHIISNLAQGSIMTKRSPPDFHFTFL